jgi:hypothetical protein
MMSDSNQEQRVGDERFCEVARRLPVAYRAALEAVQIARKRCIIGFDGPAEAAAVLEAIDGDIAELVVMVGLLRALALPEGESLQTKTTELLDELRTERRELADDFRDAFVDVEQASS